MQLIERALGILQIVAEPPHGKTLTEISQRSKLPMPTAHRLLAALADIRYVRRDDSTGEYGPGGALLHLASLPIGGSDIVALSQPHLQSLHEEFGETVFVTQLMDLRAVCVSSIPSERALHVRVQVGRDLPLHASAGARSLLAFRDDAEARAALAGHDYERFTGSTPRDEQAVIDHLAEIRREGFDICEDELDANVWAIGAPIFGVDGRTVASLTVAAPRDRVAASTLRRSIVAEVRRHAAEMSTVLHAPAGVASS